jgi:rhodanese-related sulfurtransferase/rubrerythrin
MKWMKFLTPAKSLDVSEVKAYLQSHPEGTYTLLDVRQPGEYEKSRIPGSTLIPLPELPSRVSELDPQKPHIVYCAIGGRSRAAAQFLAGQGFTSVYNLKGGIAAWQGVTALGAADEGMTYLKGDESAEEVIAVAYGMEQGLAEFYSEAGDKTEEKEVKSLLAKLIGIEEKHKEKLYQLYLSLEPEAPDRAEFENRVATGVLEGGFTTKEFLDRNRPLLDTPAHLLSLAMMLETQAFDLYMRFSHQAKDERSRGVLHQIAEDEKAHLAALGHLLDAMG